MAGDYICVHQRRINNFIESKLEVEYFTLGKLRSDIFGVTASTHSCYSDSPCQTLNLIASVYRKALAEITTDYKSSMII